MYYSADDTGSYGGVKHLYRWAVEDQVPRITRNAVREFLSRQRAYTLHKPARRHFFRNRIYVGSIDTQWQADLVDMVNLKRENNGNRYILTVIDVFSKYAWFVPVKTKMENLFVTRLNWFWHPHIPFNRNDFKRTKEKSLLIVSLRV